MNDTRLHVAEIARQADEATLRSQRRRMEKQWRRDKWIFVILMCLAYLTAIYFLTRAVMAWVL